MAIAGVWSIGPCDEQGPLDQQPLSSSGIKLSPDRYSRPCCETTSIYVRRTRSPSAFELRGDPPSVRRCEGRMSRSEKPAVAADGKFDSAVLRLAALPIPEYRDRRNGEAEGLGVRRGDLDKAVAVQRKFIRAIDDRFDRSLLLRDIISVFPQQDRISSKTLITDYISKIEDRPWTGMSFTSGNAAAVARLLRPLSIRPRTIRFEDGTAKGYLRRCFEKAAVRVAATGARLA
jgi:hypothetical protein